MCKNASSNLVCCAYLIYNLMEHKIGEVFTTDFMGKTIKVCVEKSEDGISCKHCVFNGDLIKI